MNENEWIKKADDDLRTAETMITIEEPPIWIICYHCQQVAEKYLKAYLVKNDLGFREVHNLVYLFKLCVGKRSANLHECSYEGPLFAFLRRLLRSRAKPSGSGQVNLGRNMGSVPLFP